MIEQRKIYLNYRQRMGLGILPLKKPINREKSVSRQNSICLGSSLSMNPVRRFAHFMPLCPGGNQLQKGVLENLGALYKRPNNSRAEIKALSLGQCGNVWQLKVSTPDGRLPLSCLCLHLDQKANWAVPKAPK